MKRALAAASLIMKPEGYADGLLPSIKPLDGSGDFTFTRGSNLAATRVNADGLIEKGRENLLLQSNSFNTTWATNGTLTSGQVGYDGSNDAWLFDYTLGPAIAFVSNTNSGVQTISLYAKGSVNNGLRIYAFGSLNCQAYFDLNIGSVENAGNIIDATIEDKGNGWYRCSMTFNQTNSSIYFYLSNNANLNATSGSIYIQDAQLEKGLVATDYIETTTATGKAGVLENTPRIDYSSGAGALLLEPQRSNIIPQSEPFNGGAWNIFDNAAITTNYGISPEGLQNASKIGSSGGINDFIYDTISSTIGQTYTTSFFVKNINSAKTSWWGVDVNDGQIIWDGATISSKLGTNVDYEDYGNGWYRIWQTSTATSSSPLIRFYAAYQLVGETLLYGFQVEAGSYPTSYIPTMGTAVSRAADSVYKGSINTILGSEGTLYLEIEPYDVNTGTSVFKKILGLFKTNGSVADAIYLEEYNGNWGVWVRKGNSTITSTGYKTTQPTKIAVTFGTSGSRIYFDGVQEAFTGVDTSNTMNQISTQANVGAGIESVLNIKQLVYYPTPLSNSELAILTAL